jgi:neutral ceramidase
MVESTRIIGQQQHDAARLLYDGAAGTGLLDLDGPVDYRHAFVDMGAVTLPDPRRPTGSNATVTTCKPAMGYSFAAGTTDGPGALNFTQGTTSSNPFWNFVSGLIHKPSAAQKLCHQPKPILLDTGESSKPYDWQPHVVPIQLLRVGQLAIVAVPAEFTTMSGRRIRESVRAQLVSSGVLDKERGKAR